MSACWQNVSTFYTLTLERIKKSFRWFTINSLFNDCIGKKMINCDDWLNVRCKVLPAKLITQKKPNEFNGIENRHNECELNMNVDVETESKIWFPFRMNTNFMKCFFFFSEWNFERYWLLSLNRNDLESLKCFDRLRTVNAFVKLA